MSDNSIYDYQMALSKCDPRLQEIVLKLDDEYATGRIGSRQDYPGQLEVELFFAATDYEDFKSMWFELAGIFGEKVDKFKTEMEAERLYCMFISVVKTSINMLKNNLNNDVD